MGDEVVQLQGWFREDSRLMYADIVVFIKLKGFLLTIHGSEEDPPSATLNMRGATVLSKERNYKIAIETSETKVRLYAITKHEFHYWVETLSRVAAGDVSKRDDRTSFEKPVFLAQGGAGSTDNYSRRTASIDYATRSSSLDSDGQNRATSLDIIPAAERRPVDVSLMRRLARSLRK